MSDEIAVSVRDITKKYRLFASPKDRLKEALHPFGRTYHQEFWALKGISFDISKGQVVGILGQNGSGKSTLLQILASVLRPTSGTTTVRGRVSALLELGVGFNPEFTGRQNVLLNGAVMGVPREEMLERMPEIIAFADIGDFFDQPMKIYSSGMFLRVAFAASVATEPDIFIVDEALAVGDAKFQHKCFQRLADLQAQHKTVVFVTHNSSLITSYCNKALLLDRGQLITTGEPARVVDRYYDLLFENTNGPRSLSAEYLQGTQFSASKPTDALRDMLNPLTEDLCHKRGSYNKNEIRFGSGAADIVDYVIECDGTWDVTNIRFGSTVSLYIKIAFHRNVQAPVIGFSVKTLEGLEIYGTNTFLLREKVEPAVAGRIDVFKFSFVLCVNPSDYFFDLGIAEADGTTAGAVIAVRRSIAHCVVSSDHARSFGGLLDLAPIFESVTP